MKSFIEIVKCFNNHKDRLNILLQNDLYKDKYHPIYNFLFEYFHFKSTIFKKYSPGINTSFSSEVFHSDININFIDVKYCHIDSSNNAASIIPTYNNITSNNVLSFKSNLNILRNSFNKRPHYNCYGFHEWAMLYHKNRPGNEISQFQHLPLRLSYSEISKVINDNHLVCTHFDAYRFFTNEALERNKTLPIPSRINQPILDQPGCVHVHMDLFKWAIKLFPYISSELLLDCFELAVKAREIDMRASPYDLYQYVNMKNSVINFDPSPIQVETIEGKRDYQLHQERLYQLSQPIRKNLISYYDDIIQKLS